MGGILRRVMRDERGATVIEYTIIAIVIGFGMVAISPLFRDATSGTINSISSGYAAGTAAPAP